MHKQVASLLSAGSSPGKLADYTRKLANRGLNIRAIGGAEWDHMGAVGVLFDNMPEGSQLVSLLSELADEGYPTDEIWAAEAVLNDVSGALADACERIAGDDPDNQLNVATILVVDTHGGKGLVTFGFRSEDEAREATNRLGDLAVPEHTLTAAWSAHEAWDADNPNQPPPDPARP